MLTIIRMCRCCCCHQCVSRLRLPPNSTSAACALASSCHAPTAPDTRRHSRCRCDDCPLRPALLRLLFAAPCPGSKLDGALVLVLLLWSRTRTSDLIVRACCAMVSAASIDSTTRRSESVDAGLRVGLRPWGLYWCVCWCVCWCLCCWCRFATCTKPANTYLGIQIDECIGFQ